MESEKKIEFVKWFLGTFVLVIITTFISFYFQNREQSLKEVTFYDKYATELIVLNPDIAKRRLLSQYFAHVTPNAQVRAQWMSYYKVVNEEWLNSTGKLSPPPQSSIPLDSSATFFSEHQEQEKKDGPLDFVLPGTKFQSASDLERLGWESLLDGKYEDALFYFRRCEDIYPGFHSIWETIKFLESNPNYEVSSMKTDLKKYTWKLPADLKRRVESL